MIFGIGLALCIISPIIHGTCDPEWDGLLDRSLAWMFLLGLFMMTVSVGLYFAGFLP